MSYLKVRLALEANLATLANIIPEVAITGVAVAANALFTTATPHGLATGTPVRVLGYTGGVPALVGSVYLVKVASANTFYLQNSGTKDYVAVTMAGTGGTVQAVLTAYENAIYQPAVGVPYQLIQFVSFKPDEPTQGGGYYREHGVFQVTLVYPVGVGTGALLARAELIRNAFKKGTEYTYDGVKVQITDTAEYGYLAADADYVMLPVKIGYSAQIFN